MLSIAERSFITSSINLDVRLDGRSRLACRSFVLDTRILPSTSGSSRVLIFSDRTHVLVAVLAEIGTPSESHPRHGRVECNVSCQSKQMNEEQIGELSDWLSNVFAQSSVLDLESLCIVPGRTCWVLHVDVTVVDVGGNVTDAAFMGVRAALMDTLLPRISVDEVGAGQVEYDVNADEQEMMKLSVDKVPLTLTFYQVGKNYVVDATHQEELCCNSKILIAADKQGNIVSVFKSGTGGLSPSLLNDMVMSARRIIPEMIHEQDELLEKLYLAKL